MSLHPEFQFSYDPAHFPAPPPLPSSADLFTPNETNHLLGFLDNFNGSFGWEANDNNATNSDHILYAESHNHAPYSNPHFNPDSNPRPRRSTRSGPSRAAIHNPPPAPRRHSVQPRSTSHASSASDSSVVAGSYHTAEDAQLLNTASARARPLLSTPQKRLNHIMSEQKRRNAIRDGYAQLIALLAPAGAPGIGMPTRGRPKGSGSRGKGQTKGKSGVLFRAVEYCKWLEEGRDALRDEVIRVEMAAGRR